ncbi:hypothetical protein N7539_002737 [Penicillium diatomitis]|uniref:Uncharacterized protein n=1 Tax=Penicillium diatomitis TaxID=2819901 RepID=A0A9X0BYX2_9EURO|nr:uncharacterized protein N7539_002737 [Penicillium diatomitis]KAJ5491170.1 hypothetical protein N7539_002737 [Penicillium diatomitis]
MDVLPPPDYPRSSRANILEFQLERQQQLLRNRKLLASVRYRYNIYLAMLLQMRRWQLSSLIIELIPIDNVLLISPYFPSAQISVIQLMLSRGGDTLKSQLLHYAIERHSDNITVLSLVVEKGAAINSTMYEGHYPFRAPPYQQPEGNCLKSLLDSQH